MTDELKSRPKIIRSIHPSEIVPRRVPYIQPPDASSEDTKDDDEALAISEGRDLSKERAEAEHDRVERFHHHLSTGMIVGLWISMIALCAMGISWAYHMVTPDRWHYLSQPQLGDIKTILFSGGVGAFVAGYLKRLSG